jgi:hypothetical protein
MNKECRCYNTIKGMGHDPLCDCDCHQPDKAMNKEYEIEKGEYLVDTQPDKAEGWEERLRELPLHTYETNKKGTWSFAVDIHEATAFIFEAIEEAVKEERVMRKGNRWGWNEAIDILTGKGLGETLNVRGDGYDYIWELVKIKKLTK